MPPSSRKSPSSPSELRAFALAEFGIPPADFDRMTPRDWGVFLDFAQARRGRERRREDELVARLAYFINLSTVPRKSGSSLPSVADFMPSSRPAVEAPDAVIQKARALLS